jgi:hypothetical protein
VSLSPDDARMLRELLAESPDPDGEERFNATAFQDMLRRDRPLSDSQRKWLAEVHERICGVPTYENAWSAGKVPRGREVETPAVLRNLPKRPPPRRTEP